MPNLFTRRACAISLAALASCLLAGNAQAASVGVPPSKTPVSFFAVQGGNFTLYAYKRWVERDSLGGVLATYAETTRGPTGVFMVNDKTKATSMVDVNRKVFQRTLSEATPPETIFGETSEVNVSNVMRVGYQGGYFVMYGPGKWRESGGGRTFNFTETSRTTAVSLVDASRNLYIRIDLEKNLIYWGRGVDALLQPLYAITSKSATAYATAVTPLYDAP